MGKLIFIQVDRTTLGDPNAVQGIAKALSKWDHESDLSLILGKDVQITELLVDKDDTFRIEEQGTKHPKNVLWMAIHNCVVHPLMGLFELFTWDKYVPEWLEELHDYSADRAGFGVQ